MDELSSMLVGIGMANPVMKLTAGKDYYTDLSKQIGQYLDVLFVTSKSLKDIRALSLSMIYFSYII